MTRAKLDEPHPEPPLPCGLLTARARFGPDWTVHVTRGEGAAAVQHKGDPRGDGTCPTTTIDVPCQSAALRAHHADGRQVRAVWSQRLDDGPGGKARAWSFTGAWRGRHTGELGPVRINADEFKAYTAGPVTPVLDLFTVDDEPEEVAA